MESFDAVGKQELKSAVAKSLGVKSAEVVIAGTSRSWAEGVDIEIHMQVAP